MNKFFIERDVIERTARDEIQAQCSSGLFRIKVFFFFFIICGHSECNINN